MLFVHFVHFLFHTQPEKCLTPLTQYASYLLIPSEVEEELNVSYRFFNNQKCFIEKNVFMKSRQALRRLAIDNSPADKPHFSLLRDRFHILEQTPILGWFGV